MFKLVLVLLFVAACGACECVSSAVGDHLANAEEVLRVQITEPSSVVPAALGTGKTRTYANVNVLDVYRGVCVTTAIKIRQIIGDGCVDRVMVPAGADGEQNVVDLETEPRSNRPTGVYLVTGAYREFIPGSPVFYLDPCGGIRSDKDAKLQEANYPLLATLEPMKRCFLKNELNRVATGTRVEVDENGLAERAERMFQKFDKAKSNSPGLAVNLRHNYQLVRGLSDPFQFYIEAIPDGIRQNWLDPFDLVTKSCYFKSNSRMSLKEAPACLSAGMAKENECRSDTIAAKLLARDARSVMSSLLAETVYSKLITSSWPIHASLTRVSPNRVQSTKDLTIGACSALINHGGFSQVLGPVSLNVYLARKILKNKVQRSTQFRRVNSFSDLEGSANVNIDLLKDGVIPIKNKEPFYFIIEGLFDMSKVPCKAASHFLVDQLTKELVATSSGIKSVNAGSLAGSGMGPLMELSNFFGFASADDSPLSLSDVKLAYGKVSPGVPMTDPNYSFLISDFIELHLLDALSAQADRAMQNVFVRNPIVPGGANVIGIDNDMAFGDRRTVTRESKWDHTKLPDQLPPFVSRATFQRIMRLRDSDIDRLTALFGERAAYLYPDAIKTRLGLVRAHLETLLEHGNVLPISQLAARETELTFENSLYRRYRNLVDAAATGYASNQCTE